MTQLFIAISEHPITAIFLAICIGGLLDRLVEICRGREPHCHECEKLKAED